MNSILNGWHACNCALPAMNGGSTEYCRNCANNPWKDRNILQDYRDFQIDLDNINKGHMEIEYYPNGKIKKITYYN